MTVLTKKVIEECHYFYKNTNMNQSQIARRISISQTSVAKALTLPSKEEFKTLVCTPTSHGIL